LHKADDLPTGGAVPGWKSALCGAPHKADDRTSNRIAAIQQNGSFL